MLGKLTDDCFTNEFKKLSVLALTIVVNEILYS